MSLLCLGGGGAVTKLVVTVFTLAWTHTIEKIPWEEDWRIASNRLVIQEVRLKGSGAGMEPPPDARLIDHFYRWTPKEEPRAEILVRRSDAPNVGDWRLCYDGACHALGTLVPPKSDPVRIYPCKDSAD